MKIMLEPEDDRDRRTLEGLTADDASMKKLTVGSAVVYSNVHEFMLFGLRMDVIFPTHFHIQCGTKDYLKGRLFCLLDSMKRD